MAFVLQVFSVAEYETFKSAFLDDLERRRRLGSLGAHVFRSVSDESEVVVLIEYRSAANAEQFSDALALREGVKWTERGVEPVKSSVLEEVLEAEA